MTYASSHFSDLERGAVVAKADVTVTRDDLVRSAGASVDPNPIHFNDAAAAQAGLPGVFAHGMLTATLGLESVVDWVGDPTAVVSYGSRFTRPVVVDQHLKFSS
ncbi:MaoC/PaaZ C-terminal domain-containing protein [Rhodococcus artemisiae]|uniref:MaoC/PaaZ C-terminal domain-containing protein n=1 Tax=Rhodococcus artemisiae TaxID=714159 RepID=UPI0038B44A5C